MYLTQFQKTFGQGMQLYICHRCKLKDSGQADTSHTTFQSYLVYTCSKLLGKIGSVLHTLKCSILIKKLNRIHKYMDQHEQPSFPCQYWRSSSSTQQNSPHCISLFHWVPSDTGRIHWSNSIQMNRHQFRGLEGIRNFPRHISVQITRSRY